MASGHLPSFGVLAQELTESETTRRVFLTAGGLLLLGLALLIGTVWWWRSTRPEHPALGPLGVMGERRWTTADQDTRRSLLDAYRRPGADPALAVAGTGAVAAVAGVAGVAGVAVSGLAGSGSRSEPEPVDLSLLVGAGPPPLDDLAEIDRLLGLVPDDAVPEQEEEAADVAVVDEAAGAEDLVDAGAGADADDVAASENGDRRDDETVDVVDVVNVGDVGLDDLDAVSDTHDDEPAVVDGADDVNVIDPLLQRARD